MPGIARLLLALACGGSIGLMSDPARAAVPEWNPVRSHAVQLGPEASRLVVAFARPKAIPWSRPSGTEPGAEHQDRASQYVGTDVAGLAQRTGLGVARSRR